MNLLFALPTKLLGRKSRLQPRKPAVAARSGLARSLRMEPLEQRQLLSVSIPILNGDFESPTWVQSGSVLGSNRRWQLGTQAMNYNQLDPRFGPPGFGKTALGSGGPGPNGEGLYNERNDLGYNQYFNYVNGQLPAPAGGTNFFCLQPAPGGTYHFWVDQQPNTAVDGGNPNDLNYPPIIAATVAHVGETYQATVALGNPLINSTSSFPAVELDLTLGAGSYYQPSNTNKYNYATGTTTSPQPGDNSSSGNGYGTTVAQAFSSGSGWQLTPGTFKDLTVTWTCPPIDDGLPLDIQILYTGVSQTTCMDNIRLADITTTAAAPTGLRAAGVSTSQVNVDWTDNDTNVSGFKIDQSTSSDFSTGVTTATVGATVKYYTATGLSSNTTYYYRIRAYNGAGDSVNTSTVSATTAGATGTPVAITVPDGNFASDSTGYYLDASGHNGGGSTFTQPITGTLSGWSLSANPSTANGGYYSSGGWNPNGVLDNVTGGVNPPGTYAASLGNQPASSYNCFVYYPGEQYAYNGVVGGTQPGASLTMTTIAINATAVAGATYTAAIQYANVSWTNCTVNASANVALNILANGVVVSSGHRAGLAQGRRGLRSLRAGCAPRLTPARPFSCRWWRQTSSKDRQPTNSGRCRPLPSPTPL